MALKEIRKVTGTCLPIPGDDIDTHRIIPARYLKCVTFEGLGEFLFYDVRFDENGRPKPCTLNDPRYSGATILVCGRNFGCGSSREHAPQAIYRYGFRAILAESFAEIFFGNATTLAIPCATASRDDLGRIRQMIESEPKCEVTIDLAAETIQCGRAKFSRRRCARARGRHSFAAVGIPSASSWRFATWLKSGWHYLPYTAPR